MEPNCSEAYFDYVMTLAKTGLQHLQAKYSGSYEAGIAARALEAIEILRGKYEIATEVLMRERESGDM